MAEIIGVRFRNVGKIYYFDPDGARLRQGDRVIVETSRGVECGEVMLINRDIPEEDVPQPLKKLIRVATKDDLRRLEENAAKEKNAFQICAKKIEAHKLEMKLVGVEYTFDNSKILFYFTADGRVDFRELVKDGSAAQYAARRFAGFHARRTRRCQRGESAHRDSAHPSGRRRGGCDQAVPRQAGEGAASRKREKALLRGFGKTEKSRKRLSGIPLPPFRISGPVRAFHGQERTRENVGMVLHFAFFMV